MNWSLLLVLACPLMMMFCMKGMFMGNKDKGKKEEVALSEGQDLNALRIQIAELMEENKKLEREVQAIKVSQDSEETPLKGIPLEKKQA